MRSYAIACLVGLSMGGLAKQTYTTMVCQGVVKAGLAAEEVDKVAADLYFECLKVAGKDPKCVEQLPLLAVMSTKLHDAFIEQAGSCVTVEPPKPTEQPNVSKDEPKPAPKSDNRLRMADREPGVSVR